MRNPYEVLELREGASQDDIKAAYKRLVKKYHPDQYANNPLSDLAQEKLKEINQAYDKLRGVSGQGSSSGSYSTSSSNYSGYGEIRANIERGNLAGAEQMLNRISSRNAEWNYLMGIVFLKKGWYEQGHQYIDLAARMEPGNMEYKNALNNMNFRNQGYRSYGNYGGYRSGGSCCDTCTALICADCCCECMGGDLINCC